jgi:uncharacterized protein (DUF2267 family)
MSMTEREKRENRHRANLNNPDSPEYGKGFNEPGVPPQPAQARSGQARPDRINEGRGKAEPRGRSHGSGDAGTVIIDPSRRPEVTPTTVGSIDAHGFGKDYREDRERGSGSLGSPFTGSVATFFGEIEQSGALPDGVSTRIAALAVLQTLSVRLSRGLLLALQGSLLPEIASLLQGTESRAEEGEAFDRQELIRRVAQALNQPEDVAEGVARAVLVALRAQLPRHRIEAVESQLPTELVNLWHTKEPREKVRDRLGSAGGG